MQINDIISVLLALGTLGNTVWIIYSSSKKQKPEIKKLDIEADSEIVDAANLNLEGAKVSASILLDRINELKGDLDKERQQRKDGMAQAEQKRKEEVESIDKARKTDADYFRRRIRDLEREARDYRSWAAKLVKQVVDAGKIPIQFTPTLGDSEQGLTSVRIDLETSQDD